MRSAYLTINRIDGHPDELLAAYRRSSATMDGVGRDHGLLVHGAGRTDGGLLIVNLWPSRIESEVAADDPRRLGAIAQHGLTASQMHREHHELERLVTFDREAAGVR